MSSEAITRNDLTAILNEVLPPTPSEYRKLLWTNPSPTSAFAAQTVSLDLSDYDAVEIETLLSVGGMTTTRTTDVGQMGEVGGLGSAGATYCRMATVATSGITFTEGKTNGTTNNANAIPLRIYGIKYERVNPPQIGYMPEFESPVDVVSSMINSPYWTCPADGIIVARAVSAGSATGIYIQDTTSNIQACGLYQNSMANDTQLTCTAPVLKGHIYRRNYYSGQGSGAVYYYKFK